MIVAKSKKISCRTCVIWKLLYESPAAEGDCFYSKDEEAELSEDETEFSDDMKS